MRGELLWRRDMIELDARDLIELIHGLLSAERAIHGTSGDLPPMLTGGAGPRKPQGHHAFENA
jgi:hypothetical protein